MPRARTLRIPPPLGAAIVYRRRLRAFVDALAKEALALVERHIDGGENDVLRAFSVRVKGVTTDKYLRSLSEPVSKRVNAENLRALGNSIGIPLAKADPNVAAQLDTFAEENVALIRSLGEDVLGEVKDAILQANATGMRKEELRAFLMERFEVSKSRADLIATDQTLKLNGAITKARQEGAGIERYEWSTSRDSRVRPAHAALDGQIFSWSEPPAEGHPGSAVRCRCVAVPVLPE